MKLTRLKPASDYEVINWLEKELELTPYQKGKMRDREIVRFSPFEFYKSRGKEKVSVLWRLTIIIFPFYWLIFLVGLPFRFLFTGKWGYGQKFFDNFHAVWIRKLDLDM